MFSKKKEKEPKEKKKEIIKETLRRWHILRFTRNRYKRQRKPTG